MSVRRGFLWSLIVALAVGAGASQWHRQVDGEFHADIVDGYDTICDILVQRIDERDEWLQKLAQKNKVLVHKLGDYEGIADIYRRTIDSQILYIDELEELEVQYKELREKFSALVLNEAKLLDAIEAQNDYIKALEQKLAQ